MKFVGITLIALVLLAAPSSTHASEERSQENTTTATHPKIILVVGGLRSDLSREEMERRYKERLPEFRDVAGLVQKYYTYDETTHEWAGIYLWESEEALAAYLDSDLRKSIPEAYELTGAPVIQRFAVVDVLRR